METATLQFKHCTPKIQSSGTKRLEKRERERESKRLDVYNSNKKHVTNLIKKTLVQSFSKNCPPKPRDKMRNSEEKQKR